MTGTARERLFDAANELFYAEGVQSVGINRIIDHAGVAKASLYNTFGSKEELVEAYLKARHAGTTARLLAAVERAPDPRARLLAVFDAQAEVFAEPGFHGCAFTSASAEAPAGGLVARATEAYRADVRALFTALAAAADARDPHLLARQLQVLYDGAGLAADMDHDPAVAAPVRAAAEALLDAAAHPQA